MTRRFRWSIPALLLIGVAVWFVPTGEVSVAEPDVKVDLKPVSYAALTEIVRSQKGRAIVVDVWAEF